MCLDCDFFFHSKMFDFMELNLLMFFFHDSGFYVIVRKDSRFSVLQRVHLQSVHLNYYGLFTKCKVFIKIKS